MWFQKLTKVDWKLEYFSQLASLFLKEMKTFAFYVSFYYSF